MEAVEFGDYLRKARKWRKLTIRQLELYSGVSNGYLSQLETGKRGIPSPEILQKLSKPLNISYEELMQTAGYIDVFELAERRAARYYPAAEKLYQFPPDMYPVGKFISIPIVAEISCGEPMFTEENLRGYFPVDTSIINTNGQEHVWLIATGDSMAGANIIGGSLVLLRLQPEVENGEIAAVCVDNEKATLKRVYFTGETVTLMPDHPTMKPMVYERKRIRVVGKAVFVGSKL